MKTLWTNVHIVTVDGEDHIYADGALLCDGGVIAAVGPRDQVAPMVGEETCQVVDGGGKYLFPGLINTHTHLYQELTKGRGSDLSLAEWFPRSMAPVGAVLRHDHMTAGVALGLLEAVRSGTTTVADYMQHQPVEGLGIAELDVVRRMGVRMVYGRGYRDIGRKEVVETPNHIFDDVDDLKKCYEGDGMITVWLAPAASWGLSPELMRETRAYADAHATPIMMHMFETGEDESGSMERFGKHAIDWYEACGLLGGDLLAVHSVALEERELAKYREHQVMVSYNPVSNMYLASGVAPIPRLLEMGLTVGLGTDGAGSNNSNDMLEAMKSGALLQKVALRDPLAMTGAKTLRMATIEAARALKLDHLIGSIEPDKRADFFLFDPMASVKACPVLDPVATLVYSGDPRGVDTVVIDGRVILSGGAFVDADEPAILARAQEMALDLQRCAGPC